MQIEVKKVIEISSLYLFNQGDVHESLESFILVKSEK